MLNTLTWDPNRELFVIPYLNHPVTWYGFFFALGFLVGYFLVRKLFTKLIGPSFVNENEAKLGAIKLTDRLAMLMVIGIIIGARLGHVFFYDWHYYSENPLSIFKIWEGGLASHGGAICGLIALIIFVFWSRKEFSQITFLSVLDILVMPAAFASGCIRIGNFINQEIVGIPTKLPWGVIFVHPIDGIPGVISHPVQLYESFFYFIVFLFLYFLWKRNESKNDSFLGTGLLSGCFFLLVFAFRFLIEYLKMPQNMAFDYSSPIKMGQLLSLPFILFGAALLIRLFIKNRKRHVNS